MFATNLIFGTLAPQGDLMVIGAGAVMVAVVFLALALALVFGVANEMRDDSRPDQTTAGCRHLPALRRLAA